MKTRLYFTDKKICIGSYDEVHQYEQTGQSYWASDFFELPAKFKYVGQSLEAIQSAQKTYTSDSNVRRNQEGKVTWIKPFKGE